MGRVARIGGGSAERRNTITAIATVNTTAAASARASSGAGEDRSDSLHWRVKIAIMNP